MRWHRGRECRKKERKREPEGMACPLLPIIYTARFYYYYYVPLVVEEVVVVGLIHSSVDIERSVDKEIYRSGTCAYKIPCYREAATAETDKESKVV